MRAFELFRPDSLDAASRTAGDGTVFKAAGVDLLDRLKERVEAPKTVIDVSRFGDLAAIERTDAALRLGALVTLQQLADADALAGRTFAALTRAAGDAANPQIRNRATLGGNLLQRARCWYLRDARFECAHGGKGTECLAQPGEHRYHAVLGAYDCIRVHPSNVAPPLMVLDAIVELRGKDGPRELPIAELWPDEPRAELAEHTLQPDEILTAVRIPLPPDGTRTAYRESREKQAHDWATTAAAVRLRLDGDTIRDAAICLGAVAPNPYLAGDAARMLVGEPASEELFRRCADTAYADAEPLSGNAYKVPLGKAILVDALTAAAAR